MKMRTLVPAFMVILSLGTGSALADNNPVPHIDQPPLPASVVPGGSGFTLTINGSGFVSSSTILWNGSARTTTFISAARLSAVISASDIAAATTAVISVVSPAPGGGTSNSVLLEVSRVTSSVSYTSSAILVGSGKSAHRIVSGDFNGDGKADLASVNDDGSVSVLLGNGTGSFSGAPALYSTIGFGGSSFAIATGDFNGDGKQDLVVISNPGGSLQISVLPGNGDGTFGSAISGATSTSNTAAGALLVADLNGDGVLDVVTDCEGFSVAGLCVFTGNGDGSFTAGATIAPGSTSSSNITAALADFRGNGLSDVALSYSDAGLGVLAVALSNGNGTFAAPVTVDSVLLPSGTFTASVAAGDIDGNGKADLVYYNQSCDPPSPCTGSLLTYSGNGDGTFLSALPSIGAPVGDGNVILGDFNADGIVDVAILNEVLLGNGDGTFTPNPSALPHAVSLAADFNGDGHLDFAGEAGAAGIALVLRTPPNFSGFSAPTSQSVIAGATTSYNVQVVPLFGWLDDVSLSVSGFPAGVTGSLQPTIVPGGNGASLLSISTTAAAVPGSYILTLTGVSGSITHSTTITLNVNPASADFGGDITPGSQLVAGGQQANYFVQAIPFNGFTGDITLSVSGLPPGAFASFNPAVIAGGSGSSILTVVAPANTRAGAYILTITGTSGSISHSGKRELDINTNADFTGSVTPVISSVLPGQRASYQASVVSLNGFTGTVALTVNGLPAGATAKFTPANVMGGHGSSSLVVNTLSTTPPGAYTLTITGASGSDTKSTTVPLLVNTSAGDFVGSLSPQSRSTIAGGSAAYTAGVTPLSGFTGNVTLSVSGLPPGASVLFSPSAVISGGSGSTNFTINTSVATPPGTYTILVTGTSGGLSHAGSITLTVN
jgi:hypothetical protein